MARDPDGLREPLRRLYVASTASPAVERLPARLSRFLRLRRPVGAREPERLMALLKIVAREPDGVNAPAKA